MDWRAANSLLVLKAELNAMFPNRNKASDGIIGDAAHASRSSDHNPWVHDKNGQPVVTAMDITHDPANGLDSERYAEALLASRDPRIKYVISNRKIASGADGPNPWAWRHYGGANAHNHHCHLSVEDKQVLYDSKEPWELKIGDAPKANPVNAVQKLAVLRKGDHGQSVELLQEALNNHGSTLKVDGDFGDGTDRAVRAFQKTQGLTADGIVGAYTWEKLI